MLAEQGLTVPTAHGAPKLNPVARELRSAELGLRAPAGVPAHPAGGVRGDDDQYRGLRGVYGLGEAG